MKRTQLNVTIEPKLLERIKENVRISGKSLVTFVSDCFATQLEDFPTETINARFNLIEQRIQSIEDKLELTIQQSQKKTIFYTSRNKKF